jgi:hypothetical protein
MAVIQSTSKNTEIDEIHVAEEPQQKSSPSGKPELKKSKEQEEGDRVVRQAKGVFGKLQRGGADNKTLRKISKFLFNRNSKSEKGKGRETEAEQDDAFSPHSRSSSYGFGTESTTGSSRASLASTIKRSLGLATDKPQIDFMARRLEIRGERRAQELKKATVEGVTEVAGSFASSPNSIAEALQRTVNTKDAVVLMVGYSPTGGGHTGRTLNIIDLALKDNDLKPGSTVVFHIPSIWNNKGRPEQLDKLAGNLQSQDIQVVMAEADKSVHGYLKPDGTSDDAAILERFATLPLRDDADLTSIADAKMWSQKGDFKKLPSLSANHLMDSVEEIIGSTAMKTKVKILTDMDPALQKAGQIYGVPGDNRVDQQNHAILLDLDPKNRKVQKSNLAPEMALLTKVLSGSDERVSHIGLGDKNTLSGMVSAAAMIGVTPADSKAQARDKVADFFLNKANKTDLTRTEQVQGIMVHSSIESSADVKNIVYVYAHGNQNDVAKKIDSEISKTEEASNAAMRELAQKIEIELEKGDEAASAYKDTLFVFCGADTFPKKEDGSGMANAMHLAYLGEADGITTSGAGTHGEFSYLHKSCGSQSQLLALPIHGHNEQEANAAYLEENAATADFVTVRTDDPLDAVVNTFVMRARGDADDKYNSGTMATMLAGVSSPESYVKQAKDLLYGAEYTPTEEHIERTERTMRDKPELDAGRRFMKMAYQAMIQIETHLDAASTQPSRKLDLPITIKLTQKGTEQTWPDIKTFAKMMTKNQTLKDALMSNVGLTAKNLILKGQTQNLFANIASGSLAPKEVKEAVHNLKEKFGEEFKTGF